MPGSEPTIDFCSVRVYAARQGHRVTGRVEFPYEVAGRSHVPIVYHSVRKDPKLEPAHSTEDHRAAERVRIVRAWRRACENNPSVSKQKIARDIIKLNRRVHKSISVRTLQTWARKLELEGPKGLRDKYVKPPAKILKLSAREASDAIMVCAWWAFRIGNVEVIDRIMMALASEHLVAPGFYVADVLATIDCYYAWPCERQKYPFKSFGRWVKYDFQTWLYRACDENDYRRGLEASRKERVPLQSPHSTMSSSTAAPKMRRREVLHHTNRRAIHTLGISHDAPTPPSRSPSEPRSNALQSASKLRAIGCDAAARSVVAQAAPGIPALTANRDPETMAEALGLLDDSYRRMLLDAARGDRGRRAEALATMPLWWEYMPRSVRNNIDFRSDAWSRAHPRVNRAALTHRKLDMLLPQLRDARGSGVQRLFPAARIAL